MKALALVLLAVLAGSSLAQPVDPALVETRYCGAPLRNAAGVIMRRADVLAAFQRIHPCPSTGLRTGACPGWQKNHNLAVSCGGCDSVSNLSWVPIVIKTCVGWWCIDRHERKIGASTPPQPDTAACVNVIVPPLQ